MWYRWLLEYYGNSPRDNARVARQMAAAIHHRGPDESGIWYEAPRAPILVHARLAVLELSPQAASPCTPTVVGMC